MCGRLLSLWYPSHGYRSRFADRDKGKLGRLMLMDIPRWCDVEDCPRVRGVGEACNSCQGSSRRSVAGVSSGAPGGAWASATVRWQAIQQLPGPQYRPEV